MQALELYTRLGVLLSDVPQTEMYSSLSSGDRLWIAQALALVEIDGNLSDLAQVRSMQNRLGSPILNKQAPIDAIAQTLANCLARAELRLPAQSRGAFIPVGKSFDAFAAIGRVLGAAQRDLLIVDAYADHSVLTEFAQHAPEGVLCRILRDGARRQYEEGLITGGRRWIAQFGASRPLVICSSPEQALHDRLIMIDGREVFILTQSLKDLAKKSHASLARVDDELAPSKILAYEQIWTGSVELVRS